MYCTYLGHCSLPDCPDYGCYRVNKSFPLGEQFLLLVYNGTMQYIKHCQTDDYTGYWYLTRSIIEAILLLTVYIIVSKGYRDINAYGRKMVKLAETKVGSGSDRLAFAEAADKEASLMTSWYESYKSWIGGMVIIVLVLRINEIFSFVVRKYDKYRNCQRLIMMRRS